MKTEHIAPSNLTEALLFEKVVRIGQEDGIVGTVVGVNSQQNTLNVLWAGIFEPMTIRRTELKLVLKDPFAKSISWSGITFGELEDFVQQAKREGVERSAVLNENPQGKRVHVRVPLPLAKVEDMPPPKHNHDFSEPCPQNSCPAFGYDFRRGDF